MPERNERWGGKRKGAGRPLRFGDQRAEWVDVALPEKVAEHFNIYSDLPIAEVILEALQLYCPEAPWPE